MKLGDFPVGAGIAVKEMDRARAFYEGTLGLEGEGPMGDGGMDYECGNGTGFHVYPSPENAGKSEATQLGWSVGDVDAVVDELIARDVVFERYAETADSTDDRGVMTFPDGKVAFFKDPDGNVLALNS